MDKILAGKATKAIRQRASAAKFDERLSLLGLLLDAAPYGAMLALAAGSGLVFFRKRRRED